MDGQHVEQIWENYRYLIDKKTGYSRYLRAALFPNNPEWPDFAEIEQLRAKYAVDELMQKFQAIDQNKKQHAVTTREENK